MIATIVLVRVAGGLQPLEWAALDSLLRLRPQESPDDRVVIVGIRESDIRRAGKYPVPDQTLAQLLNTLQTYQPAAIGLDTFRELPVEPGHGEFVRAVQAKNVIAIEKALPDQSGSTVNPTIGVPVERLGFADLLIDPDGKLRRSLLGTSNPQGDFRYSLAIRLAELYLKPRGFSLENGVQDPEAMRFGSVEIPRFFSNSGGYVNADAGGVQTLINFRNHRHPFPFLSMEEVQRGVDPNLLRGKIVVIGYTAPSVKDLISSNAIVADNAALIYGVESHAHMISQIVSGVLDGRPFLKVWGSGWEYVWIVVWGIAGIAVGRLLRSPHQSFLGMLVAGGCLIGISYGLLLLGWWVPLVPALLVLLINGAILAAFYRYDEALRSRLEDRQMIIDQTFDTIHNGPLQTLAQLLRTVKGEGLPPEQLLPKLEQLNRELRDVHDAVRREALTPVNSIYLAQERELDLQRPIHKTLYDVYTSVLERELPGFKTIRLKVVKFDPLNERGMTNEQKRGLCRFLEEALCNVGKHAIAPTRLEVTCTQVGGKNLLRVTDNGKGDGDAQGSLFNPTGGMGTQQAQNLAQQLRGTFQRYPREPQGMVCELSWAVRQSWLWGWIGKYGSSHPPAPNFGED